MNIEDIENLKKFFKPKNIEERKLELEYEKSLVDSLNKWKKVNIIQDLVCMPYILVNDVVSVETTFIPKPL